MILGSQLKLALKVFIFFVFAGLVSRFGIGYFSSFHLDPIKDLGVFLWGLHFDLAAAGFFTIIWILPSLFFARRPLLQKVWIWFLGFSYFVVSASDYVYVLESGRHLGYEVRNLSSIRGSLGNLIIKYIPYIAIALVSSLGLFFLLRFHKLKIKTSPISLAQNALKNIGAFLLVLVPCFICVRGFQGIPLDPSYSYRAGSVREASLTLNPVYSIIYSGLSGYQAIPEQIRVPPGIDTESIFQKWQQSRGIEKPQFHSNHNLVIIFLEGWPAYRETPLFTEFKNKQSLSVDRMFALGSRTVEGLFSSLCSWPNPLGRGIMFSQLENYSYDCLPQRFVEKGYHTAFFQGSDQLTSGVGPLAQKLGFQKSFGKNELPGALSKELNFWGLYDRDLYRYILDYIETIQEPFVIGVNTNTTHDLQLPKSVVPRFGFQNQNEKHQSVMWHADQELAEFLTALHKRKSQRPITVALVADHTSYFSGGYLDQYTVPFALAGQNVPVVLKNQFSTQKDVAATLADLFGITAPHYLGQSLLRDHKQNGILLYHLGTAVWIEESLAVVFNARSINEWKCFDAVKDPDFRSEITCPENSQEVYHRAVSYLVETQKRIYAGETHTQKN